MRAYRQDSILVYEESQTTLNREGKSAMADRPLWVAVEQYAGYVLFADHKLTVSALGGIISMRLRLVWFSGDG
jgi:hypothetical protein